MAIKDWHEDDRPREKLLKFGAENLTDAEILAIFLRTGTKEQSAIELARSLIEQFGSLAELLSAPVENVLACHGIGSAKYAQMLASLEMGKRYLDSQLKTGNSLNRSETVKNYIATQLRRENLASNSREVFALLCMDDGLNLINYQVLFVGGVSSCAVGVREVLRQALSHSATHIIIAHNHPNTPPTPSQQDNQLTCELYQACQLIGITLTDHVIVGKNDVLSYAENALPPFSYSC